MVERAVEEVLSAVESPREGRPSLTLSSPLRELGWQYLEEVRHHSNNVRAINKFRFSFFLGVSSFFGDVPLFMSDRRQNIPCISFPEKKLLMYSH